MCLSTAGPGLPGRGQRGDEPGLLSPVGGKLRGGWGVGGQVWPVAPQPPVTLLVGPAAWRSQSPSWRCCISGAVWSQMLLARHGDNVPARERFPASPAPRTPVRRALAALKPSTAPLGGSAGIRHVARDVHPQCRASAPHSAALGCSTRDFPAPAARASPPLPERGGWVGCREASALAEPRWFRLLFQKNSHLPALRVTDSLGGRLRSSRRGLAGGKPTAAGGG